ncbi:hypothetical protein CSC70_12510 [Pseudoxanthomonas kalamensis DSM 18571]|uniref:class I SAM-dependent methyltransferase n=1 Tax=Pseudoxanthomonas kalamensis TaxID=289483 RepID=UPI001391484C|nr:class I SAM-dependent methyltransferase [Pseudoxanthomonas kalamensis]KAF1708910.1 hypothetical protein CSC70_12510 [Pseudoxanthomonas kalamensis DSM 18571]
MAQYQSFPDAAGASHTLDKLKALLLPDLEGRDFLDVGCNEGFFCGFAKSQGAQRVVGVDYSRLFIERARQRFPDCEFHNRSWDQLPAGPFDVILLASALHYAEDQAELIGRLVNLLAVNGVLVLELGIASSDKSEWVKVERGIDERYFPTMPKLREILRGYAWKWMGPSIAQAGDPVRRHVIHVSRRRPLAYLLMQPPGYGKSSIAASLFEPANVLIVSGDQKASLVAQGRLDASPALYEALSRNYSPFTLDQAIQQVFDQGLGDELVRLWASEADGKDFAVDGYVPAQYHADVERILSESGYLPVQICWERYGPSPLPGEELAKRAEAFYLSLGDVLPDPVVGEDSRYAAVGFVDELKLTGNTLRIRGWAVDGNGSLPQQLTVKAGTKSCLVDRFEKQLRPDVQKSMSTSHALLGFVADLSLDPEDVDDGILDGFEVLPAHEGVAQGYPLSIAKTVGELLASGDIERLRG